MLGVFTSNVSGNESIAGGIMSRALPEIIRRRAFVIASIIANGARVDISSSCANAVARAT
jgi:hypothetical protein